MGKLEGKIAVVTGGASGIGEAIARLFAQEGARVVLADTEVEKGQMVAADIDGLFVQTDVTKEEQIKHLVDEAISGYGCIDILVNGAGIAPKQVLLEEYDRELLHRMLSIHLEGVFYSMKYVIPVMLKNGDDKRSSSMWPGALNGVIINISSNAALKAFRRNSLYSAAKAGVLQLTKVAALEHAKDGIRVNAICPGITDTGMFRKAVLEEAAKLLVERAKQSVSVSADTKKYLEKLLDNLLNANTTEDKDAAKEKLFEALIETKEFDRESINKAIEDVRANIVKSMPILGPIPPEKIAAAALFLASDEASFVTGQVLTVDGGVVL